MTLTALDLPTDAASFAKFDPADIKLPVMTALKGLVTRPRVAILREQGVNGAAEMVSAMPRSFLSLPPANPFTIKAFAFRAAGFDAVDVHMSEILGGFSLSGFRGLAACGGFSYGDVLGAGQGWAKSILMHDSARQTFEEFFKRPDTFTIGVCNGCQVCDYLALSQAFAPDATRSKSMLEPGNTDFSPSRC